MTVGYVRLDLVTSNGDERVIGQTGQRLRVGAIDIQRLVFRRKPAAKQPFNRPVAVGRHRFILFPSSTDPATGTFASR